MGIIAINFKNNKICASCRFWSGNFRPKSGVINTIELDEYAKGQCYKDSMTRNYAYRCNDWELRIEFGGNQ